MVNCSQIYLNMLNLRADCCQFKKALWTQVLPVLTVRYKRYVDWLWRLRCTVDYSNAKRVFQVVFKYRVVLNADTWQTVRDCKHMLSYSNNTFFIKSNLSNREQQSTFNYGISLIYSRSTPTPHGTLQDI